MELFSHQDPAVRQSLDAHINQRWMQLHELEKEWSERGLRYLLLTNSGGAVATLSFLGTSNGALNVSGVKISLALFVLGIFLVGVSTAKTYHHMSRLFESYKIGVDHYYTDQITWAHLHREDEKLAVEDKWDYIIPYISFGCFILGCVCGAVALFE